MMVAWQSVWSVKDFRVRGRNRTQDLRNAGRMFQVAWLVPQSVPRARQCDFSFNVILRKNLVKRPSSPGVLVTQWLEHHCNWWFVHPSNHHLHHTSTGAFRARSHLLDITKTEFQQLLNSKEIGRKENKTGVEILQVYHETTHGSSQDVCRF